MFACLTSSTDGLVNAQGFYYSPLGGAAAAVAWAVSFNLPANLVGPVPVVSYPLVYVNLQNVYNNATNKVTIPIAGAYFIDLTIWIAANATNGNIGMC
jgi:hypothetical protein